MYIKIPALAGIDLHSQKPEKKKRHKSPWIQAACIVPPSATHKLLRHCTLVNSNDNNRANAAWIVVGGALRGEHGDSINLAMSRLRNRQVGNEREDKGLPATPISCVSILASLVFPVLRRWLGGLVAKRPWTPFRSCLATLAIFDSSFYSRVNSDARTTAPPPAAL